MASSVPRQRQQLHAAVPPQGSCKNSTAPTLYMSPLSLKASVVRNRDWVLTRTPAIHGVEQDLATLQKFI
jgi:hypothetical protein